MVHGDHYFGNTDFTFSLKVYETVYSKASLDLKGEIAEVGWKTLGNFSVWDRQETKVMFVLFSFYQVRSEVLRSCAGSKWNQTQKVRMSVQ